MSKFARHFSVAEANRLLPQVRAAVEEMRALQAPVVQSYERLLHTASGNGHRSASAGYRRNSTQIAGILEHLTELGVHVKDIDRGLVDFPHWRAGKEVFLCWELGEDEILFWHDLESGCSGRQPL